MLNTQYLGYTSLVLLFVALALVSVQRELRPLSIGAALLGTTAAVAWLLLNWRAVHAALGSRQARYGPSAGLLTASFIGILVVGNIFANANYYRFDTTATKRYSLSPQTLKVLKTISDEVQIYSFFSPEDTRRAEFEQLLEEYRRRCSHIKYVPVDPDLQPTLARELEVSSAGVVVVAHGERKQKIYSLQEQDITGAILRVLRDDEPKVYFTVGHQERDPQSYAPDGYSTIARAMEDEGYKVETLNVAAGEELPKDARVIAVIAPRQAFTPEEESRLAAYVAQGGRLILLSDPGLPGVLSDLLASYGLAWNDDIAIDPERSLLGDVATPLVTQYPFSAITRDLQGLSSFFPYSRSIDVNNEQQPESAVVLSLVTTGPQSWGETDLRESRPAYDPETDIVGPLNLCVTVEDSDKGTRLFVCGDSDFVSNEIFTKVVGSANGDLFLNAINWLAEEEELISIRPKPPSVRTVILTPEQGRIIQLLTTVLMPLTVAVVGAVVWWKRRA